MAETQEEGEERLYTWEVMVIGHDAHPMSIEVTRESIANYAKSVQNDNPIYFDDGAAQVEGFEGVIAPPTMVYVYAPMRRWDIMNSRGYVGPEQARNPRSTPFVGSEILFQGVPVRPGDVITSTVRVDNRWESRSGNKFVSFRVVGHNQRGEKVVEYLYNVIWEYARGRKARVS